MIANIIANIKSIFLFLKYFLQKILFGLLVPCQSFSLDIPGKTTFWITWISPTIWEEVDGLHHWQHVRMYLFSDVTFFFKNSININFTCINQLSFLNTFSLSSDQFHHYSTPTYQLHHINISIWFPSQLDFLPFQVFSSNLPTTSICFGFSRYFLKFLDAMNAGYRV